MEEASLVFEGNRDVIDTAWDTLTENDEDFFLPRQPQNNNPLMIHDVIYAGI